MGNKRGRTLLMILVSLFVISSFSLYFVFALENDNYKKFLNVGDYGKISILDSGNTELAEYTLLENTDQCLINCYAEGTVTLYTEGYLFEDLNFKDSNLNSIIIDNKILIEIEESYKVDVNDYKAVCELVTEANGTYERCHQELTGTRQETKSRIYWKEYDSSILSPGTYKWRIEGKKSVQDELDWIAGSFGKDFTEWAWWNDSWNEKQKISINDTAGTTYNDYIIELNISYNPNMQSDFDDLRFTNGSENVELNYYLESKVDGKSAIIWVELEQLIANSITTTYMYYNNSLATSNSNNSFAERINTKYRGHGISSTGNENHATRTGMKIYVKDHPINITSITKDSSCTATRGIVGTTLNGEEVGTATFSGDIATFSKPLTLNANSYYYIVVNAGGSGYNMMYNGAGSYSEEDYFNWTHRIDQNANEGIAGMNSVVGINITSVYETSPPPIVSFGEVGSQSNYTLTFNLTDSFTGEQIDREIYSISCDNGYSRIGGDIENPYTPEEQFTAGPLGCTFMMETDYYLETTNITVTKNETIEIPMSKTASLTQEEHDWLEAIYKCKIQGIGCYTP